MDEIKRAYRKKAKEYHPDLHPDDPRANEKMQQVNEAYDMLCNPDKYRARQAAYGGYGQHGDSYDRQSYGGARQYGGYYNAGQGRQYRQYTYYTTGDGQDPWASWQRAWEDGRKTQSTGIVNPFRGVFKVIGGILLFRFIITLLRFGLFGFFF